MKININNPEFNKALEIITKKEHLKTHLFITGVAGTGKSTFLKHVTSTVKKNFVVLAPTGIAAINIQGQTIHSFFEFPLRVLMPEDEDITVFGNRSAKPKIIKAMDTLIIDEVSMVRPDLIDAIDYSLRINGGDPDMPFGGKQVVFMGDMLQLEPVITDQFDKNMIKRYYDTKYFYSAKVFKGLCFKMVEFKHNYRQLNPKFQDLLNKVRDMTISQSELFFLNTRVFSESELMNLTNIVTLTTTNKMANGINKYMLSQIKSKEYIFQAEIKDRFEESIFPTDEKLALRKGAQVMFISNGVGGEPWVNGTVGTIDDLDEDFIDVKLEDGSIHKVSTYIWVNIRYTYSEANNRIEEEVLGVFEQYPLKLSWAMTIHKSQGRTIDKAIVDLGIRTFANGQVYVAISRLRSFEGLFLRRRIKSYDITIDFEIIDFYKTFHERWPENRSNPFLLETRKIV